MFNSQVEHQHGHHHHDEAAEGGVEVDDAEEDPGSGERVHPVQPVPVQVLLIQDLASLGVHLHLGVAVAIGLRPLARRVGRVGLGGRPEVRGGGGQQLTAERERERFRGWEQCL